MSRIHVESTPDEFRVGLPRLKKDDKPYVPKPPYKPEEVPIWYPENLRVHLTTFSRETFVDLYPCLVHVPEGETETIEEYIAMEIEALNRDVEDAGGEHVYYSAEARSAVTETRTENHASEIAQITKFAGITVVGDDGCTAIHVCDLRTGEVRFSDANVTKWCDM
jgi:hypothetical protein